MSMNATLTRTRTLNESPFELEARLLALREAVRSGAHKCFRADAAVDVISEGERERLSWTQRAARLITRMCEAQQVVILPEERIVFTRTVKAVPPLYPETRWRELIAGRKLHELGPISNICADWGLLLREGLLGRRSAAMAARQRQAGDPRAAEFLDAAIVTIDAVLTLAARYAAEARVTGRDDVARCLERVPAETPRTFHEALQALRLCHAVLWLGGHYHCGLGRFDQYLWPILRDDLENGRLTSDAAEQLLAEFFISLNKDSDLYPGIQQGDNGQSLMLGGVTREGDDAVNPLTWMVLRVARGVALIDPKINLRVTPDTDIKLLETAAELTRMGLGFPQYSNDAVVIPGLVANGYALEDARDYTVAACWEFIIPGRGMEVVNIGAVSLPAAADAAIRAGLAAGDDFEGLVARAGQHMRRQVEALAGAYATLLLPPAPYYSVFMDGCLERGRDLSEGLAYNNFGVHGACSSGAADALAAVREFVFERCDLSPERLLAAMDTNFKGEEALRQRLQEEGPKAGNNDDRADALLVRLFDLFADACAEAGDNGRGGRLRPGSGSAMYYVWLGRGHEGMREPVVGATADGRHKGDFFGSSLAPSQGIRVRGPLSVLQSFGKIDYRRICNGGPVTMELSDSVFRNPEAIHKVGLLVRLFAQLGCQQLQINTLNPDTLREAKVHPERHRNLVVRVWGWSGYFCELDEVYQDHIIGRHLYGAR